MLTANDPKRDTSGFTLIELMIVVSIIGILAAIATPNYLRLTDHAREAKVKSSCHTVQLAAENFVIQNNGVYPASLVAVSNAGENMIDLLPGGLRLENAWTKLRTEPRDGAPGQAGEVGFVAMINGGFVTGYTIDGHGKTAIVLTVRNGS